MSLPRTLGALLATVAGIAACGGGSTSAPAVPGTTAAAASAGPVAEARAVPTDAEIADLLYTDRQRVPAGFYAEPMQVDATYTTVTHLRNTDLDPATTPPHELCARDFAGALAWSETAARAQPVYGDLVGNDATVRAWEFTRRLRSTPARTVITRIYRCDYLDRAGVDLRTTTGPAGRFGIAAWAADDLRDLGEYLWTFGVYNNAGYAVLRSDVTGDAAGGTHTLVLARLVRAQAAVECDSVELWRLELRADRATGALTRSETQTRSFRARRADGLVQTCG